MNRILKRIAVASLLILLATAVSCGGGGMFAKPAPALPPEPTLIAIRDAGSPSWSDKTPTPYTKKKPKSHKSKTTKAAKPEIKPEAKPGARPPDCPKCPETGDKPSTDKGAEIGAQASNPVLDALAKELSLALDTNKASEQPTGIPASQSKGESQAQPAAPAAPATPAAPAVQAAPAAPAAPGAAGTPAVKPGSAPAQPGPSPAGPAAPATPATPPKG